MRLAGNLDVAESFWKDGYVHIKSVFDENEILMLRKNLLALDKKIDKNKDLMLENKINTFLLDNRLLKK